MRKLCIVATALALATPLASAEEKKVDPPAARTPAAQARGAQNAPERQAAQPAPVAGTRSATAAADGKPEIRDWAKIDVNQDHLISPEEMQKYLEQSWAARKK